MAVDLSESPWTRLARFSPADATEEELQEAADLYEATADIYRAAAEIWSWRLSALDLPSAPAPGSTGAAKSVSQGDISVTYAAEVTSDPTSLLALQRSAIQGRIDYLLGRAPVRSATFQARGRRSVQEYGKTTDDESVIWVF